MNVLFPDKVMFVDVEKDILAQISSEQAQTQVFRFSFETVVGHVPSCGFRSWCADNTPSWGKTYLSLGEPMCRVNTCLFTSKGVTVAVSCFLGDWPVWGVYLRSNYIWGLCRTQCRLSTYSRRIWTCGLEYTCVCFLLMFSLLLRWVLRILRLHPSRACAPAVSVLGTALPSSGHRPLPLPCRVASAKAGALQRSHFKKCCAYSEL